MKWFVGPMVAIILTWPAQSGQFLVRTLSVEDGLTQSTVNVIFKDREGFMWVGTSQGLNRYDGYHVDTYLRDPDDPNSLLDEDIQALFQDDQGIIWVATFVGGISRLDPKTNNWSHIEPFKVKTESGEEEEAVIFGMAPDNEGNLLVSTHLGLIKYHRSTGATEHFSKASGHLPHDYVWSIFIDSKGTTWLGTENGLVRKGKGQSEFESIAFTLEPPVEGENNAVKAIEEDPFGRLWLGTRDGVFVFKPGEGTLHHLPIRDPDKQSPDSENLWDLEFDGGNHIWGATFDQGVVRWNLATLKREIFQNDPSITRSLKTNTTKCLFFEESGTLWIGTRGKGVAIWNADSMVFQSWHHSDHDPTSLSDNEIWDMHLDDEGNIWARAFRGVNKLNVETGKVTPFLNEPGDPNGLTSDLVNSIAVEPELGRVFVQVEKVIDLLDPKTGKVTHLDYTSILKKVGLDPENAFPGSMVSPARNRVIFTFGDSLVLWDLERKDDSGEDFAVRLHLGADFERFGDDRYIAALVAAPSGELMVSSTFGAFLVQPDLSRYKAVFLLDEEIVTNSNRAVSCMSMDPEMGVWVGTYGDGLFLVDSSSDTPTVLRHYTVEQGLPSNAVYAIVTDHLGHVWSSSMFGLSRLDVRNGWVKHFDYRDGLPGNEFNQGAVIKDRDGRLYFGGVNGIVGFNPAGFTIVDKHTPAVFTRFESVDLDKRNIPNGSHFELKHSDLFVKISFSVLDYTMPEKNSYKCKLKGFQDGWTSLGSQNSQTYTNLDAGSYTFLLQAMNSDGVWDGTPLKLHLRVLPAPWLTPIAFLGYFLLVAAIIGVIWRLQHVKVRERRANTLALKEREQRLTLALWGSGDTMWDWEASSNTFLYTEITGSETHITTQSFEEYLDSMHLDDVLQVKRQWKKHLKGNVESFKAEFRRKNERGEWVWISQRGMIVQRDDKRQVTRIAGTLKDITASKLSENNLKLLANAFESTLEAMVITDEKWTIMRVNQAFSQITGYSTEQIVGKSFHILNSPEHDPGFFETINTEITKEGFWQGEVWIKNMFGRVFPTWRTTNTIRDTEGKMQYMTTVFLDISQHKKQENELRLLANYDHLTGLPNRSLFHDRLQQALAHSKRNELKLALCFLDLDRFKWINDSYGHKYGDHVLREVAKRLKELVREQDTVARLGGDEFVIILEDIKNSRNAGKVARKVVRRLADPMDIEGTEFVISTSLGIASYPEDGTNSQTLITNSDAAMYFAKNEGRNNYQFYETTMNAQVHEKLDLENRLRKAIQNEELIIHFQPRFCLQTLKPLCAEVLLRWHEPDKGIISPADFIPVAEDTGLIIPIGEWVMNKACACIQEMKELGLPSIDFSINLSSRQFKEKQLAETVQRILTEHQVDPRMIELEITEGTIMERTEQTLDILRSLKETGVTISVDDFGTGYSSLSYLQRFPLNALKIDKGFVAECLNPDGKALAIVKAIVSMGKNLGLRLVAEGIENKEQYHLLKELECEEGQGFYVSRPLSFEDFQDFLKDRLGS